MNMELPIVTLVGFLLALVRTTAWMSVSPPFNNRALPRLVKLGSAAGISMAVASQMPVGQVNLETGPLAGMVLMQIVTGLALGLLTQILFSAVSTAGNLIDVMGGFTMSQALDPFGNNQSSTFGRFYQMLGVLILFAINGHLMLIKGFMTSFEAVPLGGIQLDKFKDVLLHDVALFSVSAIEIAGPLLAAYFLADIGMGLLSKAAPQLNILSFGFPFKILLTLLLVGTAIPLLPNAVHSLVNHTLRDGMTVLHATSSGG